MPRWELKHKQLSDVADQLRNDQREELRRTEARNEELELKVAALTEDKSSTEKECEKMTHESSHLQVAYRLCERKCLTATQKLDWLLEQEQRSVKVKAELSANIEQFQRELNRRERDGRRHTRDGGDVSSTSFRFTPAPASIFQGSAGVVNSPTMGRRDGRRTKNDLRFAPTVGEVKC